MCINCATRERQPKEDVQALDHAHPVRVLDPTSITGRREVEHSANDPEPEQKKADEEGAAASSMILQDCEFGEHVERNPVQRLFLYHFSRLLWLGVRRLPQIVCAPQPMHLCPSRATIWTRTSGMLLSTVIRVRTLAHREALRSIQASRESTCRSTNGLRPTCGTSVGWKHGTGLGRHPGSIASGSSADERQFHVYKRLWHYYYSNSD